MDGLRAIAVILVILYHLDRSLAPGGFVGVDIFFAISGFVVTGSVLAFAEVSPLTGPFDAMARFWHRRILRILPALLFAVMVTFLLTALFTPQFPVERYAAAFRTGISALFGLSNFYLYRGSFNYFTVGDATNPFVHTWSLAVEEQFYFLFALAFIGLLGFVSQRGKQLRIAIAAMAILGTGSLAAFLVTVPENSILGFYLIPFRFWEIAAGSLLAYCEPSLLRVLRPHSSRVSTFVQGVAVLGLVVVVWPKAIGLNGIGPNLVGLNPGDDFSVGQILGAVLSTIVVIGAGSHGSGFVSRLISKPLFVSVGLVSYSLYLWHYPVLLLWKTNLHLDRFPEAVLALLVVAAAALFSYRTVERKFRYSSASFPKVLLPTLSLAIFATAGFAWLAQSRPGFLYLGRLQAWKSEWLPPADFAYSPGGRIVAHACKVPEGDTLPAQVPKACVSKPLNTGEPAPTLLLLGDSHAFADWGMASVATSAGASRLATIVYDGCHPGPDASEVSVTCRTYWERAPALASKTLHQNDTVLIAFLWELRDPEVTRANQTIEQIARAAKEQGAEVLVEAPLPTFEKPAYSCTEEWFRTNYEGCQVDRSEFERRRSFALSSLHDMARRHTNVRIWDPVTELCSAATCSQFRDRKPLFRDLHHLSYFGSKALGPPFLRFWRKTP